MMSIDADSDLARAITDATSGGSDVTVRVVAHDPTFTDTRVLATARLLRWEIRRSCGDDHPGCTGCPEIMELEWAAPLPKDLLTGFQLRLEMPGGGGEPQRDDGR